MRPPRRAGTRPSSRPARPRRRSRRRSVFTAAPDSARRYPAGAALPHAVSRRGAAPGHGRDPTATAVAVAGGRSVRSRGGASFARSTSSSGWTRPPSSCFATSFSPIRPRALSTS